MDGLRANLSREVKELRDIVEAVLSEGEYFDEEDLLDAMNDVIRTTNVLCCVYDDENTEDMNDIGDRFGVDLIEVDDDEDA
jgi:hypothetical protein